MSTINAIGTPAIVLGGPFTMSGAFTFTGTLTNTTAVTFPTSGTLATTSQILTPATVAGTSQSAAVNTAYILLSASQTTVTLPAVYAVGDVVELIGSTANTGGWILTASTGDTIRVNNSTTSAGGTVTTSAVAGQTIRIMCDVANTSWVMQNGSFVLFTTA